MIQYWNGRSIFASWSWKTCGNPIMNQWTWLFWNLAFSYSETVLHALNIESWYRSIWKDEFDDQMSATAKWAKVTEWYSDETIKVYDLLQNTERRKIVFLHSSYWIPEGRILAETPRLYFCDMQWVSIKRRPWNIETWQDKTHVI